jgi:phage-related protein
LSYLTTFARMVRDTRPISWVRAARRDFEGFPPGAQLDFLRALTMVAEGQHPDIAKPLAGLGTGVLELALRYRGDAYRVVYVLQLDVDVWIIHAFQKKSKQGIKTPRADIDLIRERLKRLKEVLR